MFTLFRNIETIQIDFKAFYYKLYVKKTFLKLLKTTIKQSLNLEWHSYKN